MTKRTTTLSAILMGLLLAVVPANAKIHQTESGDTASPEMADKCRAMMQKHKAMQEEMAQTAARLKELQTQMNATTGEKKTEAMAQILNTLVNQHLAMQEKMSTMMPEMMQHMSEHMASGAAKGMKESMGECMMMKGGRAAGADPDMKKGDEGDGAHH